MAGRGNHSNSSSTKPPSSSSTSSQLKSSWKSPKPSSPGDNQPPPSKSNPPISKNNPPPKLNANPSPSHPNFPPQGMGPPRRPAYGFHMLDQRTIVLSDGSVRSYFALPADYQDFPGPGLGFDRRFPPEFARQTMNLQEENCLKRKYYGDDERGRDWREVNAGQNPNRYSLSGGDENRAAKYMRTDRGGYENLGKEVDQDKLKRAFLRYVKLIHENADQKKNYLLDGKEGPLRCYSCGRSSKDFPDMHSLIMHTYNKNGADLSEHLGLHKALCILMGWNYLMPPDNSMAYQFLSADEAAANQDDLIIWPPMVIIHNMDTGKVKDGRKEGLGNIVMNTKIRELGFPSGRSKSCYWREGHIGITLIKFAADQSGLREAIRLAKFLEKSKHGRQGWAVVQSLKSAKDRENHPSLVTVDPKTGEKDRILYGYLGTASDLDRIDPQTKRKIVFESKREWLASSN